jgi:hypothetical protein
VKELRELEDQEEGILGASGVFAGANGSMDYNYQIKGFASGSCYEEELK